MFTTPRATIPRQRGLESAMATEVSPTFALDCRPAFMYDDVELRVRQREQTLLIGSVALRSEIDQSDTSVSMLRTAFDQLRAANEGNKEGYNGASANVYSMIIESTKKYANSVEVFGRFDASGKFEQFGQVSDDFLENTFRDHGDSPIARAEARDILRFEELVRSGHLQEGEQYHVLSLIPQSSRQDLADRGYFLESMSFVHRVMTLGSDGAVSIRSNFIAGVDMQQVEKELGNGLSEHDMVARQERALQLRHDHEVARRFYSDMGIELGDVSAETVLGSGFITPAGSENQVVQRLDQIAAEITGKDALFYGTDEIGDYTTFLETSMRRAESFQDITTAVVGLAQEYVRAGLITEPRQVPGLFRDLVKDQLVDRAIYCNDIDLRVFGTKAAPKIIEAQTALMAGDFGRFSKLRQQAQAISVMSDCPHLKKNNGDSSPENPLEDPLQVAEIKSEDSESGACDYQIDSCYCSPYNIDGTEAPKPLDVRVIRDQTGDATCTRCTACINSKGDVKNYGYIKARADMLKITQMDDRDQQNTAKMQGKVVARAEVELAA